MHGLPQSLWAQQAVDGAHWPDRPQHFPDQCSNGSGPVASSPVPDDAPARLAPRLADIVEAKIIPRLVQAHQRDGPATNGAVASAPADALPPPDPVDRLVAMVLAGDIVCAVRLVETLCWTGASFESLCTGLLAPSARRLAVLWNDDRCDFAQITIALWRLQQLLQELGPQFPSRTAGHASRPRVLLVPVPGEEPTLGLAVAMTTLADAGWRVAAGSPSTMTHLRTMVGREWFDLAAITVSGEAHVRRLAQNVDALRKASRNPKIRVLVGGSLLGQRPDLVAVVGADGAMTDSPCATAQAGPLRALLARAKCG
jgi:MerR family transcriptional regulator, light-induced transcriptional regulator